MTKRTRLILLAVGLFAALLAGLYLTGWGLRASKETPPAAVKQPDTAAQAPHASHGSQPEAEQAAEKTQGAAPALEIPPEKQQLIGIKKVSVEMRAMQRVIRTVGKIEIDERRLKTVNAKVEGWIERLHVDFAGRYVQKGEPLAELYSPELVATQQELVNLLKWKKTPSGSGATGEMIQRDAEALIEGARQRLRRFDIPEAQIREIEQAGAVRRTLTIASPVSGYVIQKMALQGMRVMPGEKLFDIADLSVVWVVADIYEYELPNLKVGDTATIRLSYFPGREFRSMIDYLSPTLSGETRTAKARFTIPNEGGRLKPQMFASVEIVVDLGKKLAVPADAVIETGTRAIVYVDRGDGYFEPREVALGARAEGFREVLKGLKAGDQVAASAAFLVDSEAQIKGVKPLEKK